MTSILKVDTIQDQSGNNIINESSDTITIGASGDTITIPSGATISNLGTATGFGKVLQVVSTAKTDTFSTTGATFVDITGLSVSITPSSSSNKIMIIASIMGGTDSASATFMTRLMRGATAIGIGDSAGSRTRVTWGTNDNAGSPVNMSLSLTFLDSPSTTSATTYKVQLAETRNSGDTAFVNRDGGDIDNAQIPRGISTITVMEIAG
jgi:hypothetical protein